MSYAQLVDVNEKDASNIDMVLLKKATVSGVIEVPENAVLPEEGLHVRIYVSNDVETYSANVTIPYVHHQCHIQCMWKKEPATGCSMYWIAMKALWNTDIMLTAEYIPIKRWLRYSTYIIKTSAATS